MGQEISGYRFAESDFVEFRRRLDRETQLLAEWFHQGRFADAELTGGLELEAWLVDEEGRPAPVNTAVIKALGSPLVVPELARFNVEINTTPHVLAGSALGAMREEMERIWTECGQAGAAHGARLLSVGILPSVHDAELSLGNMSSLQRYRALNEQVLRLREGRPIDLNIRGRERLAASHRDVMLEAAATSLQIHLQVSQDQAARYYNASKILSGPMVAIGANSPFLFGRDLWAETRVPLFQQAVAVAGSGSHGSAERVSFGLGYVGDSLFDCFETNRRRFDVLLPKVFDTPPEEMAHLRLHNGTIWRWNRPLIGFHTSTGEPHLRIEHRVVAAPNSIVDTVANVALFFGLVHALATRPVPPESQLSFEHARRNFYTAARHGLDADVQWLRGRTVPITHLLDAELLPLARAGLEQLALDATDIAEYLDIIQGRLRRHRNGTEWQRNFVAAHGHDMLQLTQAYAALQATGAPVHEWRV